MTGGEPKTPELGMTEPAKIPEKEEQSPPAEEVKGAVSLDAAAAEMTASQPEEMPEKQDQQQVEQ